jgi:hypothetical protein
LQLGGQFKICQGTIGASEPISQCLVDSTKSIKGNPEAAHLGPQQCPPWLEQLGCLSQSAFFNRIGCRVRGKGDRLASKKAMLHDQSGTQD